MILRVHSGAEDQGEELASQAGEGATPPSILMMAPVVKEEALLAK